jgi:hypothetical protein
VTSLNRLPGQLRHRVELANRVNDRIVVFEANRCCPCHREDVDHLAPQCDLAGFIDSLIQSVTAMLEVRLELPDADFVLRFETERRNRDQFSRRHSLDQGARRADYDPWLLELVRELMKHPDALAHRPA